MDPTTQAALRQINRRFYSQCAADFDRTRRPGGWPGWRRVVRTAFRPTNRPLRILDLGCGNGRFARFLERNPGLRHGRPLSYVGIDQSRELVEAAASACAGRDHIRFEVNDIETCVLEEATCDLVTLFGVLHHLPGFDARRQVLERAASSVAPGGLLALACWQFADAPGFEDRRLDWDLESGIEPADLEPGDHLLRWGPHGSHARRYCHHAAASELERLVPGLPLAEVARYRSDGPGGRRNLYWLGARDWPRPPSTIRPPGEA